MSEYQYYEFRTINRQLTAAQRTAVNRLSSHGHTTATSFSVDYSWGDFKHNPDEVLAKYFDIFFYTANWGSVELKFCYPKELIDLRMIEPYCIEEGRMTFDHKQVGERVILSFESNADEGIDWVEGEGMIDGIIDLYTQILQGDRRIFYLAWLRAAGDAVDYMEAPDEDTLEPPVPPQLGDLSPALHEFVDLFGIDKQLITVAAQGSEQVQEPSTTDLQQALNQLTKAEATDFLRRLLEDEPHLDLKLKQRIGLVPPTAEYNPTGTRTIGELLATRKVIQRQQAQAAAAVKEAKRRAEMAALAARGDAPWSDVETLIAERKTDAYRQAAQLLRKLHELADEQGQSQIFASRLEAIRTKYRRLSALMRELRNL